ncbi:MAG: RDD family protein [Thermoplasmata archaeon]|nr:RDD family protein [Thermoplasmata archaeon]
MVTGFDIWGHDPGLRSHWKYRFGAFAVDAAIAFAPTCLVLYFFDIANILQVAIVTSAAFYLSTVIPETMAGASVGKRLFQLKVHPLSESGLGGRVCIRNLDRIFWFALPPINFALGMAMRGDPRQTALDRVAGTVTVHREEKDKYDRHIQTLQDNAAADDPAPPIEDLCQACGGRLMRLPNSKLQCGKCGLIQ